MDTINEIANAIWSIRDILRSGFYGQNYIDVVLSFTLLSRCDCVLQWLEESVPEPNALHQEVNNLTPNTQWNAPGFSLYNTSAFYFRRLLDDRSNLVANMYTYIEGFNSEIQEILKQWNFDRMIDQLDKDHLLYLVIQEFTHIDLSPKKVSDSQMISLCQNLLQQGLHFEFSLQCPPWLVEFMIQYLEGRSITSIIDPSADSLLLIPLTEALHPRTTLGIVRSRYQFGVVSLFNPKDKISWMQGNSFYQFPELIDDIDLIINCGPWGDRSNLSLDTANGLVAIQDSREALLLLQSCLHLIQGGIALFVLPSRFIQPERPHSVYANLARFDLAIDAILTLPARTFISVGVPTILVIIQRVEPGQLFVGEVSQDRKRNKELLKNLKARKSGTEVSLGALVDPSHFHSYNSLVAQHKVQALTKKVGLQPVPLSKVAKEINFTRAADYPGFTEHPNAIYLPIVGRGKVITSLSQAELKRPSSYVQIVLDPDKAINIYVAGFFNTSLGQLVREQWIVGTVVPRISWRQMRQGHIYLPSRETQIKTIEADTKATNLISEIKSLQERAWGRPQQHMQILQDIEMVNHKESEARFTDWLDILPFPLASILWRYHTVGDDHKKRYELLLHFFEALAEFLATILLSGFFTSEEMRQIAYREVQEILQQSSIEKSTFGTWVSIAGKLAKDCRAMLNGNLDDQNQCRTMFGTQNRDILKMLFSKELIALLQETNENRNAWVGHGGIVSLRDSLDRHTKLENRLSRLRTLFSTYWESYILLKAGITRYSAGVYLYTVEQVTGCRIPFEKKRVKTDLPMEDGQLYILGQEELRPLKILPFVKVMPSPKTEQEACYFYSRIQSNGIRFVSYHFEGDADIVDSFRDTADTLQKLMFSSLNDTGPTI
jgi:HsdM N-terminal domain